MSELNKYPDEVSKEEWFKNLQLMRTPKIDIKKLIMDYLLKGGYGETAKRFQNESGLDAPENFSPKKNQLQIRQEIQNGRTQEATQVVNALHPEILGMDKHISYQLQRLHLVQLIRDGKVGEAAQFAQLLLSEYGKSDPVVLDELERTLARLPFEHPLTSQFHHILES